MKVLIIRFSSIGDIVLTTPVIRCVHLQLGAEIHVITKRAFASILEPNPYVARIHALDNDMEEVLPALQREQFDLVIDLHKNIRSIRLRKQLTCPSIGFDKLNVKKWLLTGFKIDRLPRKHLVDRYFESLSPLGVTNDQAGLDYFIPASETVDPQRWIKGSFGVLVLGAAHMTKRIPIATMTAILADLRMPILLVGGPGDVQTGEELVRALGREDVVNLAGQLTLHGSADVIRQAAVVITPDTGMMHIAAAFRKPVVSVWGNTVSSFGMYPYIPGHPEREIRFEVEGLACRPCSKIGYDRCPKGHFRCMTDQPARMIARSAMELTDRDNK